MQLECHIFVSVSAMAILCGASTGLLYFSILVPVLFFYAGWSALFIFFDDFFYCTAEECLPQVEVKMQEPC